MKSSKGRGRQAAFALPQEEFDASDEKEVLTEKAPSKTTHHPVRKSNIIGLAEDSQLNRLKKENQRLKELVEDLVYDKTCQARRIAELSKETSRLKKKIAELVAGCG